MGNGKLGNGAGNGAAETVPGNGAVLDKLDKLGRPNTSSPSLFAAGKSSGVEAKHYGAPVVTPSMRSALHELDLQHVWILYLSPTVCRCSRIDPKMIPANRDNQP